MQLVPSLPIILSMDTANVICGCKNLSQHNIFSSLLQSTYPIWSDKEKYFLKLHEWYQYYWAMKNLTRNCVVWNMWFHKNSSTLKVYLPEEQWVKEKRTNWWSASFKLKQIPQLWNSLIGQNTWQENYKGNNKLRKSFSFPIFSTEKMSK